MNHNTLGQIMTQSAMSKAFFLTTFILMFLSATAGIALGIASAIIKDELLEKLGLVFGIYIAAALIALCGIGLFTFGTRYYIKKPSTHIKKPFNGSVNSISTI